MDERNNELIEADVAVSEDAHLAARISVRLHVIRSADLFCGERQVYIDHDGQIYRLCLTRNGRLILQK